MQVQELVGIVPWTFVAQICNLFIQMYLVKRFLFKPVNEMLRKKKRNGRCPDSAMPRRPRKRQIAMKTEYEQNMQQAKEKANQHCDRGTEDSFTPERGDP